MIAATGVARVGPPSPPAPCAAADLGRDLLQRATGGRPSIDPAAGPGQPSRTRQVRVAADLDSALDAVAHARHRRVSDVLRDALTDHVSTHRAS